MQQCHSRSCPAIGHDQPPHTPQGEKNRRGRGCTHNPGVVSIRRSQLVFFGLAKRAMPGVTTLALKTPDDLAAAQQLITDQTDASED